MAANFILSVDTVLDAEDVESMVVVALSRAFGEQNIYVQNFEEWLATRLGAKVVETAK